MNGGSSILFWTCVKLGGAYLALRALRWWVEKKIKERRGGKYS